MRIIVFNSKGGVGKSTIAANLAVISGSVLLDADPQATCCYWRDRRQAESPEVIDVSLGRVAIRLRTLEKVIVDLPGASVPGVPEALSLAQRIIVPVSYDQATLDALPATLELVRHAQRPLLIVLNRVHPRTHVENILAGLASLNVPLCSVAMRERANHRDWWANGEVAADHLTSDAGQDISRIWQWITEKPHG